MQDLQKLIDEIRISSDKLFGEKRTSLSIAHHLTKESEELISAIVNGDNKNIYEELADCLILILNVASKNGIDAEKLILETKSKLQICDNRKWGNADENGVIEHISE